MKSINCWFCWCKSEQTRFEILKNMIVLAMLMPILNRCPECLLLMHVWCFLTTLRFVQFIPSITDEIHVCSMNCWFSCLPFFFRTRLQSVIIVLIGCDYFSSFDWIAFLWRVERRKEIFLDTLMACIDRNRALLQAHCSLVDSRNLEMFHLKIVRRADSVKA